MAQAVVAPAAVVSPSVVAASPSGIAFPEGILWTALATAASYAAIQTGIRTKGFNSVVGWAGGVAAGLGALVGLAGILAPSAARSLPVRWYWA
jgi:hypothetical protein